MFIAFAAVLACGMDGMRKGLKLSLPVSVDPATLDADSRKIHGVKEIPRTV